MGVVWTMDEARATVEDYFSMLSAELKGISYNKTDHRKNLVQRLDGRSDAAVERKHQSVSAVLLRFGMPYIDGYKPLRSYQVLLEDVVRAYLRENPQAEAELLDFARKRVSMPPLQMPIVRSALVEPPRFRRKASGSSRRSMASFFPSFDFAQREAGNAGLKRQGEAFAIRFEEERLGREGRSDLAERIEWTARTKRAGAGYDILSYEANGKFRHIAVKTTNCGREFPFFVSRRELERSTQDPDSFTLYRVFNFSQAPRLFILEGSLEKHCRLAPETYRGSFD